MSVNKKNVIFAILAHPDDESFGMGGTLALYASRGVDVHLVCATRGEAGEADTEHMKGFDSIAELRESELRCAAGILGLKSISFLGYRDSGMRGTEDNNHPDAQINHPVDEVAGRITRYLRDLKPDLVITHDPIGGYRHPDHIHIHQAARLAFEKSDDAAFHPETGNPFAPHWLYYHTFPHGLLKVAVFLLRLFGKNPRKFGKNNDIDFTSIAEVDFPIHARINIRSVMDRKDMAGTCHSSQGGGSQLRRGPIGMLARLFGGYEDFMQAYPVPGPREKRKKDLFG